MQSFYRSKRSTRAPFLGCLIGITFVEWKALTSYEWVSVLISIAGFAGIILTLYVMHREYRLSHRAAKENALVALKLQQLEIDKIFLENPELRKYFYEDVPLVDETSRESIQALSMAEYMLDHFAAILPHTTVEGEPLTETIWRNYIRDSFSKSRVLSELLQRHRSWYPAELTTIHREALGKRASIRS